MKAVEVTKAVLKCPEKDEWSFTFPFNPSSLNLTRQVNWDSNGSGDEDPWGGELAFGKGQPDELEFEIMLDETLPDPAPLDPEDFEAMLASATGVFSTTDPNEDTVVDDIKALQQLTMPLIIDAASFETRPPAVVFQWGSKFEFLGVVTSLDTEITLVNAAGDPKRATVKVQLKGRSFSGAVSSIDDFYTNAYTPEDAAASPSIDRSAGDEGFALSVDLEKVADLAAEAALVAAAAAGVAAALGSMVVAAAGAIADLLDGDPEAANEPTDALAESPDSSMEDAWWALRVNPDGTPASRPEADAPETDIAAFQRERLAAPEEAEEEVEPKKREYKAKTHQDLEGEDGSRGGGVAIGDGPEDAKYLESKDRSEEELANERLDGDSDPADEGYEAETFWSDDVDAEHVEKLGEELPGEDDDDEGKG